MAAEPSPRVLWLTDRGERHQRNALKAAPPSLEVIIKRRPTSQELNELLPTIEYLISERSEPVTAEMIRAATKLKHIVRLGSLIHDIDVEAARAASVRVSLQPVLVSCYAAEYVMMMILALLRRLNRTMNATLSTNHRFGAQRSDENQFFFNWLNYQDIGGLYGKTVAILGMGEIGVELARRLKPFGLGGLYYYKRNRYPKAVEYDLWLRYGEFLQCVKQADVIVSLLPYSEQNDRRIRSGTFAVMKSTALLVHAGSGGVIDEQALVEALQEKRLGGAALDTYEFEPLQPTHSLVKLARDPNSNLLLTPHIASAFIPGDRSDDYGEIVRAVERLPLKYEVSR